MGKQDSTGNYVYTCDGTAPGSPVLSDIYNVYTPGQSEHRGSTSYFYSNDRQSNLWTTNGPGKNQASGSARNFYGKVAGAHGIIPAWQFNYDRDRLLRIAASWAFLPKPPSSRTSRWRWR